MSADPESSASTSLLAVEYGRAAERVRAAIAVALEPGAGFAEQVEAGLRSALGLLVVRPFAGGAEALACYERWQRLCAEALREAAACDPEAYDHPPFFEPALVSDLCAQVARQLGADPGGLRDLLPGLLELVHACYFGPERAPRLVDA